MGIGCLNDFRVKLFLAFSGIVALILFSTGFAIYSFNRFGTVVDTTIGETIPEMASAMQLSESSALLAVYAPVLAAAGGEKQLLQISAELEKLVADIDRHTRSLTSRERREDIVRIVEHGRMMTGALADLKAATKQRLALEKRLQAVMKQIREIHEELIDTVNPVEYGASSLTRLFGNRTARQNVSAIRRLRDIHAKRVIALLELRIGGNRLASLAGIRGRGASRGTGPDLARRREALVEKMRKDLAILEEKDPPARIEEIRESIAAVIELTDEAMKRPDGASFVEADQVRLQTFNERIERVVDMEKVTLAFAYREAIRSSRSSIRELIDGTVRDMRCALDIKSEGNLMISLLNAAAKEERGDAVSNLRQRFRLSRGAFHSAVAKFKSGPLARRNPILAGHVLEIETRLAGFAEGGQSPFFLRLKQIAIDARAQDILADGREIAVRMTESINSLTRGVQADAANLKTGMRSRKTAGASILLFICIGSLVVCIFIALFTLTVFRLHERDLVAAKEAAENANLAKSQFLANMSHELRTPLNHIIGFTEMIVDKNFGDLNEIQEEYLNDALSGGRHLLSLINDILDLSKVEAGKLTLEPAEVQPGVLLSGSLMMIKERAMKHGIRLSTDIRDLPDVITADERALKQILYNLLSNAVKFTPDGGCIRLMSRGGRDEKWQMVDAKAAETPHPKRAPRDFIEISVTDTGIGLKPDDLDRVFDAFEQVENSASRKFQGTGLGLSLTRRLVELHGGRIWAESEGEGRGSVFTVVIPLE
ncbi:MAG: hypothetical protein GY859_27905 [Desulfobacterales bacterium]|nr:hypothetical protein [Desulfobacterales bacterium]